VNTEIEHLFKQSIERSPYSYIDNCGEEVYQSKVNYKKFAELIVERCIDIVDSCDEDPKAITHEPYSTIADKIAQIFFSNQVN
jgi:hypothetical protein